MIFLSGIMHFWWFSYRWFVSGVVLFFGVVRGVVFTGFVEYDFPKANYLNGDMACFSVCFLVMKRETLQFSQFCTVSTSSNFFPKVLSICLQTVLLDQQDRLRYTFFKTASEFSNIASFIPTETVVLHFYKKSQYVQFSNTKSGNRRMLGPIR